MRHFAARHFAPRHFAARHFVAVVTPPFEDIGYGGGGFGAYPLKVEAITRMIPVTVRHGEDEDELAVTIVLAYLAHWGYF